MNGAPYIAEVAALIGDPARANMLGALKEEGVLSATELAVIAGVASSTASEHLGRLIEAQLINCSKEGRHRYYQLANDEVADTLESLEVLASVCAPRSGGQIAQPDALLKARVCYDHLAGAAGASLTSALIDKGLLLQSDNGLSVSPQGDIAFADFGIDVPALRQKRRALARSCKDWSNRSPHLGGALGAAVFARLKALDWLRQERKSLVVGITPAGRQGLRKQFGAELSG